MHIGESSLCSCFISREKIDAFRFDLVDPSSILHLNKGLSSECNFGSYLLILIHILNEFQIELFPEMAHHRVQYIYTR
jgi:hypothetical protein